MTSDEARVRELEAEREAELEARGRYGFANGEAVAAATALLERWLAWGAADSGVIDTDLFNDTDTFLANRPAAPVYRCATHEVGLANEAFFKCGCRYFGQPATPTRTEAERVTFVRQPGGHWCTEAEEAVLDAMAGLPEGDVRAWAVCPLQEYRRLGEAELARRGLQP